MNAAFESRLNADLDALRAAGTYKRLRHITGPMAPEVHMEEAGDVIVLSSNNYLGLADHPDVVAAGIEGLKGFSSNLQASNNTSLTSQNMGLSLL